MTTNNSLLRKADIAIADIQANGGELLPEQGASFIRKLIKQPTLIRICRVVEMTAPKRKINKIGFGKRILRKATSGVALAPELRAKPTTQQLELSTHEQIAEVRLPYDVLEDNIERAIAANNEANNTGPGGLRQTLIDLIAERAAADTEELALKARVGFNSTLSVPADAAEENDFLGQLDGWMRRGERDGNVVDVEQAAIDKKVFKAGLKTMPSQYLRNRAALQHFVSVNNEVEYRDTLSDRGSALGDQSLVGNQPLYAYGSPVTPAALMAEDEGFFSDPLNLIFGIQRQISMEFDKDITARVYIIVLTMRIDFQIEEPEAMVTYENIGTDIAA